MSSSGPQFTRALASSAIVALFALFGSRAGAAPYVSPQERNWELMTGRQMYESYTERGEILARSSPLYRILDPIAGAIASVADRQYYAPFQFVLLDEAQPNAFAMPGGKVYVTTGLLAYLRNSDQLAGVICHEVNHDIHHDMYNVYEASLHGAQPLAYERDAETNADRAGAYTCARAGFNPWGMVWNMREHRGMAPSRGAASSDHPSDDQRLVALTALLTRDAAFGRFKDDIALSKPLGGTHQYAAAEPPRPSGYAESYPSQYPMPYQPAYPPQSPYSSQYPVPYPPQYPPPPPCYPGC